MNEEKVIGHSPTPTKVEKVIGEGMTFNEAIKEVIDGKKIHKLEWENKEFYGFLNDEWLSLHKPDGKNYQWIINDGDLKGTDWIVIA